MKKFEVGKRYSESGITYEILKRTPKTVKYALIYHAGKFNEKVAEVKSARIKDWGDKEVFCVGSRTVEA